MATRRNSLGIEIDFRALEGIADGFGRLGGERMANIGVDAVNQVGASTEQKFRERIAATINLSDAYLRGRMQFIPAQPNAAVAEAIIRAPYRHTPLSRYDPAQLVQPVKRPDRAKGDPARGIPKGRKPAGMTVEVTRGSRKTFANAFTIPTRPKLRDSDGNPLLFTRKADGKLEVRYGPSVYQLVRVQIDRTEDEVGIDLELAVLAEAERAVEGIFQ